jgi:hypothetical protein
MIVGGVAAWVNQMGDLVLGLMRTGIKLRREMGSVVEKGALRPEQEA